MSVVVESRIDVAGACGAGSGSGSIAATAAAEEGGGHARAARAAEGRRRRASMISPIFDLTPPKESDFSTFKKMVVVFLLTRTYL